MGMFVGTCIHTSAKLRIISTPEIRDAKVKDLYCGELVLAGELAINHANTFMHACVGMCVRMHAGCISFCISIICCHYLELTVCSRFTYLVRDCSSFCGRLAFG